MDNEFNFIDAIEMIVDMRPDRNITIDFNNELITVERDYSDCSCNPVVGQHDQPITQLGKNIGWIM